MNQGLCPTVLRYMRESYEQLEDGSWLYPTREAPNTRTIIQLWKIAEKTNLIGESEAQRRQRMRLAEQTLIKKISHSAMVTAISIKNTNKCKLARQQNGNSKTKYSRYLWFSLFSWNCFRKSKRAPKNKRRFNLTALPQHSSPFEQRVALVEPTWNVDAVFMMLICRWL